MPDHRGAGRPPGRPGPQRAAGRRRADLARRLDRPGRPAPDRRQAPQGRQAPPRPDGAGRGDRPPRHRRPAPPQVGDALTPSPLRPEPSRRCPSPPDPTPPPPAPALPSPTPRRRRRSPRRSSSARSTSSQGSSRLTPFIKGREAGFVYARDGHPNAAQLAAKVAALEGGEAALVCASGMAAESALMLAMLDQGDRVAHRRGALRPDRHCSSPRNWPDSGSATTCSTSPGPRRSGTP